MINRLLPGRDGSPRRRKAVGSSGLPWGVVWAGAAVQLLVGSLLLHSYGAYVVLLRQEFGWSRTMLSAGYSMMRVESGLLGPLQGWVIDHFGPRAVMRVGVVLFGVGFMLFSRVGSPVSYFLAFFLLALGSSLAGWLSVVVAVVRHFHERRATAIAVAKVGTAVGGLMVPLVTLSLQRYGWRATALCSGLIIVILGPVLVHYTEPRADRDPQAPPDRAGVPGDGAPAPTTADHPHVGQPAAGVDRPERAPAATSSDTDYTAREAVRTRAFWMLSLGHSTAVLVVGALLVHLIPHLTENLGYSLREAGLVVSVLTAVQLVGNLSGGWLGDRLDKRLIIMTCMAMHAAGLLMVTFAVDLLMVFAFTVLHGLAWGARAPLIQALRADYFGSGSFGAIAGWSSMLVMIGQTTGPIVAGVLSDSTGSYRLAFTILASFALGGSLLFWAATPPDDHRRRRRAAGARTDAVADTDPAASRSRYDDGGSTW